MPVTLNATDRKGLQSVYDLCPKDLSKKSFESELNTLKREGKSASSVTPLTSEILSDIKMKGVKLSQSTEHMKAANIATWVFLGLAVAAVALAIFAPMIFLPLAGIFGALAITSMGLMIKAAVDNVKLTNELAKLVLPQLGNLGKLKESQSGNDSPFVTFQKQREAEAKETQKKTEEDHKQALEKAAAATFVTSVLAELLPKYGVKKLTDDQVNALMACKDEKELAVEFEKLVGKDRFKAFMGEFQVKATRLQAFMGKEEASPFNDIEIQAADLDEKVFAPLAAALEANNMDSISDSFRSTLVGFVKESLGGQITSAQVFQAIKEVSKDEDFIASFVEEFVKANPDAKLEVEEVEEDEGDDRALEMTQEQFNATFINAYNLALQATKESEDDEVEDVTVDRFEKGQLEGLYQIAISGTDENGEAFKAAIQKITNDDDLTAAILENFKSNENDDDDDN